MVDISLTVTIVNDGDRHHWKVRCMRANGEVMILHDSEEKRTDAKRRASEACSLLVCSETLATVKENAGESNG